MKSFNVFLVYRKRNNHFLGIILCHILHHGSHEHIIIQNTILCNNIIIFTLCWSPTMCWFLYCRLYKHCHMTVFICAPLQKAKLRRRNGPLRSIYTKLSKVTKLDFSFCFHTPPCKQWHDSSLIFSFSHWLVRTAEVSFTTLCLETIPFWQIPRLREKSSCKESGETSQANPLLTEVRRLKPEQ